MTLSMNELPPFRPLWWIPSGFVQTLAAGYWPNWPDSKPTAQHTLVLDDQDRMILIENRPEGWNLSQRSGRIAVLVHGLAGDHQSNYMIRITRRLVRAGVLVFRVNLRGCGVGFGLAQHPYHSGRSEDIRAVTQWITERHPESPISLMGFSLGGNIVLKMAGEDGSKPTGNLDSVLAVSPPVDLAATAEHLKKTRNLLFDQFFVWKLKQQIKKQLQHFPALPRLQFHRRLNLTDIDELFTAPRSGFRDAQDYYARSSCGPWVSSIRIPGLILCAKDDPIVNAASYSKLNLPSGVDLIMPSSGGHLGFFGHTGVAGEYEWMDSLVVRWTIERG